MRVGHMLGDTWKEYEDGGTVSNEVEGVWWTRNIPEEATEVARSATSCFVFGPTLCQTGSSCLRTIASNERKYAFSTLKSSRSSCQSHSEQQLLSKI